MKNTFIYIALINIFTFDSFAQKTTTSSYANNTEVNQKERISLIKGNSAPLGSIDYYLVEEKINQKFGGYIRTYKVSNYNLIDCYDLGPNNTRTITPYYETIEEKKESKSTSINSETQLVIKMKMKNEPLSTGMLKEVEYINKAINDVKIDKHIYINVIETYERIAEKGGKSIDIFKKIADANFFKEDFEKAAKWYTELFKITAELDPEYYERFAFALNSIGKKEKANEIKNKLNKRLND